MADEICQLDSMETSQRLSKCADDADLPPDEVVDRLVRWLASQSELVQMAVLSDHPEKLREELRILLLKRIASGLTD